jgi:flagellar biosynthetic protein FliR
VTLQIDTAWALSVFLLSVRLGTMLALTPLFSSAAIPALPRVLLVLMLSALLAPAAPPPLAEGFGLGALVMATVSEAALGAILAFGIFAALAAFTLAGKLLDIQIGFGVGSIFDPVHRRQSAVIATGFDMLAVVVFFAMEGHHALLRGFAYSLQKVPPGAWLPSLPLEAVSKQFGVMFTFGMVLIAPVVFCVFLTEIGLAILSRLMPQVHIFFVGMPVRVFIGLALLVLTMPYLGPVMGRIFMSIFTYWEAVLG